MAGADLPLQLRNLGRMRAEGKITPEEYDARVALISDGDPTLKPPEQTQKHPDSLSELVATEEVEQPAKTPSKTNEEWMLHYLRETVDQAGKQTTLLESIKAWVTFFGVLLLISLVLSAIILLGVAIN